MVGLDGRQFDAVASEFAPLDRIHGGQGASRDQTVLDLDRDGDASVHRVVLLDFRGLLGVDGRTTLGRKAAPESGEFEAVLFGKGLEGAFELAGQEGAGEAGMELLLVARQANLEAAPVEHLGQVVHRGRRRCLRWGHVVDGVNFGDLLGPVAGEAAVAAGVRVQSPRAHGGGQGDSVLDQRRAMTKHGIAFGHLGLEQRASTCERLEGGVEDAAEICRRDALGGCRDDRPTRARCDRGLGILIGWAHVRRRRGYRRWLFWLTCAGLSRGWPAARRLFLDLCWRDGDWHGALVGGAGHGDQGHAGEGRPA